MGLIADKRLNLIRSLLRTLPQASLRSLEHALGMSRDEALVEVRDLISLELEYVYVKEAVFAPFLCLFQSRQDGLQGVRFQPWLLDNLWRALEAREPELYKQSRYAVRGLRAEDPTPVVFFRLVNASAAICRECPGEVLPPRATAGDAEEVAEFANYLDLHRILRGTLSRLHEFMGRIDADRATAMRLMFRDAGAANPEGGYRFMECLFANLDDGAQIVKFIATVSDRPNDRFLASSELAGFGERILDRIDDGMATLKQLMGTRHRPCEDLNAAGAQMARCLSQMQAFETYIELSRDGPWGKRIADSHKAIAEMVENQLKSAEKLLGEALPTRQERVYGRVKKDVPRLEKPAKPESVERARQTLTFARNMRNAAQSGGFAALHAKTVQTCEAMLDEYFESLLGIANGGEPFDADALMACFEVVTDLMDALCGEEKAQTARRRVASSDINKPQKPASAA